MPATELSREEFALRIRSRLIDPAFEPLNKEIDALISAAWDGYSHSRKSPRTAKAGPGYADPDYELATDWIKARADIDEAQRRHDDPSAVKRVLLINGSSRSEHTCPGEMSKSYRLCKVAEPVLTEHGLAVDLLDLSRLTSEMGRQCRSTSTHGKTAKKAKEIELKGWDYPKHLAGRLFSVVVHGDTVGAEGLRRNLADWLTDLELITAGTLAEKDGYIGYMKPYATSHEELDKDTAFEQDVRSAATTLARAIKLQAGGQLQAADEGLRPANLK